MKTSFLLLMALCFLCGCNRMSSARKHGGSMTVDVPKGNKILFANWKDEDQLWYLYRPMSAGDVPGDVVFQEKSTHGLVEGRVIFHESR